VIELDGRQTLIIAILVLFLGKTLNKRIKFIREYNIPEPVTGGVLASLFFGILYFTVDAEFVFSLEQRDSLLSDEEVYEGYNCKGINSDFFSDIQSIFPSNLTRVKKRRN